MNPKEKFDKAMDYIDEHITDTTEDIKNGLSSVCGTTSLDFGKTFSFFTHITLSEYIRKRKLYYTYHALAKGSGKSIIELSSQYTEYSDQASFSKAFKKEFDITPGKVKEGYFSRFPDNRIKYDDFDKNRLPKSRHNRHQTVMRHLDDGYLSSSDIHYLDSIYAGYNEYPFDIDSCYQIAELSENLGIGLSALFKACFSALIDSANDNQLLYENYCETDILCDEYSVSSDEADKICEFFDCDYFELSKYLIVSYRKKMNVETVFELMEECGLSENDITPETLKKHKSGKLVDSEKERCNG